MDNPNNIIVGDLMTVSDFGQMLAQAQAAWNEKHPPTLAERRSSEYQMFLKWYDSRGTTHDHLVAMWEGWWARANDGEVPENSEEGK